LEADQHTPWIQSKATMIGIEIRGKTSVKSKTSNQLTFEIIPLGYKQALYKTSNAVRLMGDSE